MVGVQVRALRIEQQRRLDGRARILLPSRAELRQGENVEEPEVCRVVLQPFLRRLDRRFRVAGVVQCGRTQQPELLVLELSAGDLVQRDEGTVRPPSAWAAWRGR